MKKALAVIFIITTTIIGGVYSPEMGFSSLWPGAVTGFSLGGIALLAAIKPLSELFSGE